MIAFGPTTKLVPSTTRPAILAPASPRDGTTSRRTVIRPLNIDTLRSSTRAAVTRDQPILRIDPSAGYEYAPAPAFPSNVPSAARTSASPSVPPRAGEANCGNADRRLRHLRRPDLLCRRIYTDERQAGPGPAERACDGRYSLGRSAAPARAGCA